MDLKILRLTYFLLLKRRSIGSIQFNGKIINMIFPIKIGIIFTSRYLRLSEGYSFLQHNFIFKSPLNLFCLDLKIFQFFTQSKVLICIQPRCVKSAQTNLFSFFIELLKHKRLVSSAKWWIFKKFIALYRSFIYDKNRRGPRTDL